MNIQQRELLNKLAATLIEATDSGLLDELAIQVNPDVINKFCDAVCASAELER